MHRIRAAATTEPGRLRSIGAVLAALLVLFGAVTAWQVADRKDSAVAVVDHSQPLSADAARVYRSLADANTSAASGFLAGGDEPRAVRQRYEKDIRDSAELLATAAANSDNSRSAQRQIAILNRGLPVYTGLVESARANNRQGLPLGGAYLRYADDKMRGELLPAARKLYTAETARLDSDYGDAKSWPFLAIGVGVLALGALGWAQRRNYRRTNRVFNQGLLGATAATVAVLVWLVGGHALARSGLGESEETGARSLQALNETWISALQARGDENMTLVARGGGAAYEDSYKKQMAAVTGSGKAGGLAHALSLADDPAGRSAVQAAEKSVTTWKERHAEARGKDNGGNYDEAVDMVIGAEKSTGESFDKVDDSLDKASGHEQGQFESAANDGLGWFSGLSIGAMVLAVLGAAAAVLGIGRRLAEYR
ncbi:hypothetical protein [Streptomyces iconiensis]|uniref:Secreted protein n=1 Tax=Streptomyces iconiensis TaxID=1384038 RepID=A0ABT7A5H9_9ACTN|nr:hypothetical protein [Streptomyces iconiensis]MDJ1136608.1 hypothetical protein [Streptomyces iconiensis]